MDVRSGPGGGEDAPVGAQIRTFLIADVRGYTLFTQRHGDEAAAELAGSFADITREVVDGRGGTLLELRGDEALCVFTSAREAIRAAVDLQRRFVDETLARPDRPLTVGIGLDAGEAVPVHGGYRGGALNLAARLCSTARAGEILASREVAHLARKIEGARYEDRGTTTFKGIDDPVAVSRVVPDGDDPAERLRPFTSAPPTPTRAPSRRAQVATLALVLAVIAVAIPLALDDGSSVVVPTNSVALVDAASGHVQLAAAIGERPGASAIGFDGLWVVQPDRGSVARLSLEDGEIRDTIPVGRAPAAVAVGDGSVWVANSGDGTVTRIDPTLNVETQVVSAGGTPVGIAVGGGALWIADASGGALLRVDLRTDDVATVPLSGRPSSVAFTEAGVWVTVEPNTVVRVDPEMDRTGGSVILSETVGSGPTAVRPAFGSIWVSNHFDGTVTRLDPSSGRTEATIPVGQGPNAATPSGGVVWVANELDDSLTAIDPVSNEVERTVKIEGAPMSLAGGDESLWLTVGASATQHRGGRLVVAVPELPDSLDPAVAYASEWWSLLTVTNDGLLAYRKVGGPGGASLVPDLAAELPQVSDDGLTYRFPLRRGITYSTGDPIRPEDFRHAIERTLVLHEAAYLLRAIDGAAACMRGTATDCDLSGSIEGDGEALTIRLATPDPELPFKLAMPFAFPVPADTPMEDQGLDVLPATGPYMVDAATSDGIELIRNPAFTEWSAAAQPDGYVDSMVLRPDRKPSTTFRELDEGDVDVMLSTPPPDQLARMRSAHPERIVEWPGAITLFVGFDTAKPPFDDVRVRRAVSAALRRDEIVEILGGEDSQRLTCQILPPNFQGYVPHCPSSLEPQSGTWSAPDLEGSRELLAGSDAIESPITVLTTSDGGGPPQALPVMRSVADTLRNLGFDVRFGVEDDAVAYFERINPPGGGFPGTRPGSRAHPHVFMSGWFADYPAAGNFIVPQFSCGPAGFANVVGWCDPRLDARMEEAMSLLATDPGAANRLWTEIEHELVDHAVHAPVANPVIVHAVGDGVGNVQVNPQWGLMLGLLWVE